METYLLDWTNLLLRWLHVIVAIAWIGSSFYFVFLDSSLTTPEDEKLRAEGATGEIWAVHGGGFYHPVKYAVSPPKLPGHLHRLKLPGCQRSGDCRQSHRQQRHFSQCSEPPRCHWRRWW